MGLQTFDWSRLIQSIMDISDLVYMTYSKLVSFFSLTLNQLYDYLDPYPWVTTFDRFWQFLTNTIGLGDVTLFTAIFGSGLFAVLMITIVKWVIGIIT